MPSSKPTTPHWRCDGVPRCQEQCGSCQTAEIMQPLLNAAPQEKGRIDDSTTALSVASPADAAPSDTPRTDAEIEKNSDLKGIRFVTIAFARQLERELAAAPDLLAACEKALYALKGRLLDQIDQAVTDIESAWREQMMTGTVLFANDDDTLQYDAKERIKKAVVALRSTASEIAPSTKAWSEMDGHERAAYNAGAEAACTPSAIPRRLTVETFDGDEPAVACGISWIIRNHDGQPDHACATCVPGADSIIEGFICYYHQALELKAEHG